MIGYRRRQLTRLSIESISLKPKIKVTLYRDEKIINWETMPGRE